MLCVYVWAGYVIEPISSKNVFFFLKISINESFDMSEMFVSSLWKGDFDNLFTAMCAFKEDID